MTTKPTMAMAELRHDPLLKQAKRICVGLDAWPGLMPTPKHDSAPPRADLMNPQWRYTPANKTDVRVTWARHGWKPTTK